MTVSLIKKCVLIDCIRPQTHPNYENVKRYSRDKKHFYVGPTDCADHDLPVCMWP